MAESKPQSKSERPRSSAVRSQRLYESEALSLQSLRLIAAPNPEDDLTDEELDTICKNSPQSSALIQHLIEYIKTI